MRGDVLHAGGFPGLRPRPSCATATPLSLSHTHTQTHAQTHKPLRGRSSTIFVNGNPIVKGNIAAGKAIIHEVNGLLLPPALAEMLGAYMEQGEQAPDGVIDEDFTFEDASDGIDDAAAPASGAGGAGGMGATVVDVASETDGYQPFGDGGKATPGTSACARAALATAVAAAPLALAAALL